MAGGAASPAGARPVRRPAVRAAMAALLVLAVAGLAAWAWPRLFPDPLADARRAYDLAQYDRAARLARARMRESQGDSEAIRLLARSQARLGDHEAARRLYQALGRDQMQVDDLYLLADGLLAEGQRNAARDVYAIAAKQMPERPESLVDRVGLLLRERMYELAAETAETLSQARGHEAAGLALLGRSQMELHDPEAASKSLSSALRLDPDVSGSGLTGDEANLLLARALLAQGRGEEAADALHALRAPGPDQAWLLGRAALQRGAIEEAASAMSRPSNDPGHPADPTSPEPSAFAGSASCVACHAEIHRAQQASRHARTFARAPGLPEVPMPAGPVPDPGDPSVRHEIRRDGDRLTFETHVGGETRRADVRFLIGSGDKGLTPVGVDQEGQVRELRLSHYPGLGWDRTTGQPEQPDLADGFVGRTLSSEAERRCVGCHTTDFHAAATGTTPAGHDRAIGCEKCHGPGANHLIAVDRGLPDLAIGRPRLASAEQIINLCGQCHRPPNDAMVGDVGDANSVRFQAATLVRSACYARTGTLDCITCHDPHRDASPDRSFYESICLACHSSPDAKLGPLATGSRRPVDPESLLEPSKRVLCASGASLGCIDCHMPQVSSAMLHTPFTDHHIRVHPATSRAAPP